MIDPSFIQLVNPLDPFVVLGPGVHRSAIVQKYTPTTNYKSTEGHGEHISFDTSKTEAIVSPLVKLNNRVLDATSIVYMSFKVTEFAPTLRIIVRDSYDNIQNLDMPGMNNVIAVAIASPVEGAGKTVNMDFYITSCKVHSDDNTLEYEAEFKHLPIDVNKFEEIPDETGPAPIPTWKLMKQICAFSGLGFAMTKECDTIDDKRWRQVSSRTYKDYIKDQITFAGLDEQTIMDCWIDQYGYLVLINLHYVYDTQIDPRQLGIHAVQGLQGDTSDAPKPYVRFVARTLTNDRNMPGNTNLFIQSYEQVTYNDDIRKNGIDNSFWYLTMPGDTNTIEVIDTHIEEESVDGSNIGDYDYVRSTFLGVEFPDDLPLIFQKRYRNDFLRKKRAKQLVVTLKNPNLELQRGTCINVAIYVYDVAAKDDMIKGYGGRYNSASGPAISERQLTEEERSIMDAEAVGLLDPGLSGMYVIDGIEFSYEGGASSINETLYLTYKWPLTNAVNKYNTKIVNK